MGADAHDAGPEGWERRSRRMGTDAHDAGPEGWERKSRRPPMRMMLARRAGKGETGRR